MEMSELNNDVLYDCPRCDGTGEHKLRAEIDGEVHETCGRCHACAATGRVTAKSWDEWCRAAYREPSDINWEGIAPATEPPIQRERHDDGRVWTPPRELVLLDDDEVPF
jgi:hypothetical protein